eukprot:CAMPEP_0195286482 /NCGR_PEP_ID=MMETSP0707-20130614/3925_1 /TAXON_ID=33640 /ORGANISM="Asterionellopsis glacialis, Strain CCMP134" /LENGTH=579 /DNA_ID=CAMNT_0040346127 /DNA_START=18 /DNA_END=1757 /DNA_ORIENTATION=+
MSTLFGKSKRKRKQTIEDTLPSNEEKETQQNKQSPTPTTTTTTVTTSAPAWATFEDLGLSSPLVATCKGLGFSKPTPVQRTIIPFLLQEESSHVLALASTGSGKTAAFVLPILHRLSADPYGIYAVVLTPTRELAKQIHQQVLALGSAYRIQSALVVGGLDSVRQSCELDKRPHFVVATPGRLAELLRGPNPPRLKHIRYMVLDEADRLLQAKSGFERDVAELLLHSTSSGDGTASHRQKKCQTLLFSATLTRSLESIEEMAGGGRGRLPLQKFVIREEGESSVKASASKKQKLKKDENDEGTSDAENDGKEEELSTVPHIPAGLKQEYVFMPSRVRDAYLLTTIRTLMMNGGRRGTTGGGAKSRFSSGWNTDSYKPGDSDDDDDEAMMARSAIIFVSTCERAAMISGILSEVGVDNVALHSLLSQNRRLAALGKFKSQYVRILVATDVASRGLDIPSVDLVLNSELPRRSVDYVHRVGRTARAGRRGRAISFVAETDVALVHAAERMSGRPLEKCDDITDEMALKMLGPVTKAARLAKMKLMDIGFDELVKKMKERKVRDRKERERIERALQKIEVKK